MVLTSDERRTADVAPLPTVAVSPAVSLHCAAVATGALAPRPVKAYRRTV